MTDRGKVINGLKCVLGESLPGCPECAYKDSGDDFEDCLTAIAKDALELLKEKEPVKPKSKVRHGAYGQIQHFCGNCNAMLHGKQKYCSECGKEVKWE